MTARGARTGTGSGQSPVPVAVAVAARHTACILAYMHWTAAIATARTRALPAPAAPARGARPGDAGTAPR